MNPGYFNIGGKPSPYLPDPNKYNSLNNFDTNTISVKSGFDHVANVEISANQGSKVKVIFQIKTKALTKQKILQKCKDIAKKHNLLDVFNNSMPNFDNGDGFGFIFGLIDILSSPQYQNVSLPFQPQSHRFPGGMKPGQIPIFPPQQSFYPIFKPTKPYDIRHDIINSDNNQKTQELANQFSSLTNQEISVSGQSTVQGISQELCKAKIFVKITTIRGKDKKGNPVDLKMISSQSGQLQDLNGNKKNDVKLNVVPL